MKVKLLLLTLLMSVFSWGQITEGFESTTTPAASWTYTSVTHETTNFRTGARCAGFNATNDAIVSPLVTNPNQLSFWWKRSGTSPTVPQFTVQYGSSSTGPWTNVTTGSTNPITSFTTTYQEFTADLSLLSNVYIRILHTRTAGANIVYIDDFSITTVSGFSLTYNGNGSTSGTVPTDATSYASGATVNVLGNTGTLAKTGYTFAGWNTLANGTGTNYVAADTFSISANTTLYAKWTPNNNTITFDKNAVDATGTTATQTIATAATASLTANGFSRVGYTFGGWATTPIGAVSYADGASYTMGLGNVTLYAIWNSTSPFITISGTLVALSTTYGTASSNTTFTVSAGNLTNNLIIAAPTGFEVSLTAGTGFATSIDLGASDRTNTTIFVRLAATTDFGTYNGNVVASSIGVTSVNVATASSNVTKKQLTITGLLGVNKVYDGTTTASMTGAATLTGIVFSDDVTISGTPTSNFVDKNVGTGKAITIAGYSLAGTKAANYSVSQPTGVTGNITTKALSITTPSIASKVYDGSAVSGAVTVGTLTGFISPETVTTTATGAYADANAGIGKSATVTYVLANGVNGGLATNYSLAIGTGIGDITQATPVFTTSTIAVSVGGTYTLPGANITSTSPGALSYSITPGGFATITGSTINGVSVGSEILTVTQAASLNYLGGSTMVSVNVSMVSYTLGDYRTNPAFTGTIFFNSTTLSGGISPWQTWNGANWIDVSHSTGSPNSPQNLATKPDNIYLNGSYVDVASGAIYNNIIVEGGYVYSGSTSPGLTIAANKTLDIKAGYLLIDGAVSFSSGSNIFVRTNAEFEIGSSSFNFSRNATSNFTVEDNGFLYLNNYLANIWNGNENFAGDSIISVYGWNNSERLFTAEVNITNNSLGSKFGYLEVDLGTSGISGNWTFVFPAENFKLTNRDFIITNSTSNNVTLNPGTMEIGRDFIVNGTGTIQARGQAGAKIFNVRGNFVKNGTGNFRLNTSTDVANPVELNVDGNLTINDGFFVIDNGSTINLTSKVNLKGNLFKAIGSYMTNSNTNSQNVTFNFIGNSLQTVNLNVGASTDMLRYYFYIKNGAYVSPTIQDWKIATDSKIIVESGGTLDFGFGADAITPLNIVRNGAQIGQTFTSQDNSILKITSPQGITTGGNYTGNIQVGTNTTSRSISQNGIFHYIAKANQVSGSGLPSTAANKHVIVELETNNLEFTSTNGIIRFNNPTTAIGSNFKGLEIRRGTVIADDGGNRFEDSATSGETGNLKMTGGIYKIFSRDIQPAVSGNYDLSTGSKIIFAHTTAAATTQAIRGGTNYQYPEIEVEGKDVRYSNIGVNMKSNGLFTIKENAILTNTGNVGQIVSLDDVNPATLTVKNTGIFKTEKEKGFNGVPDGINPSPSVRTNHTSGNVLVTLEPGSTVEYSRAGDQIITLFSPSYRKLTISGTGVKTLQNDSATRVEEDLRIDAAKLGLNAGQILTVKQGVIIAATGAEFEVLNNAQLIQIDETDTNLGTNFKVQRLAFVNAEDYVYWSSPVENFNVGSIPTQQRYFWNPIYVNTNGTLGNWNSATGSDATMIKGKGYIVNSGSGYPVRPIPATSLEANFVGRPNNGTLTTTIQRGTNAVSIDDNWNLIGNPYPSAIFAEEFLDANVDKINGSVWVWTHGHAPDNAIDPYYDNFGANYYATDYLKYNKLGATDTTFNGIIASGQGFMVNMLHTTPLVSESVTFTNAMRTDATATPYNNSGFFKTANTNLTVVAPEEKHRIWLDIVNTTIGQKDAALLGYSTNATLAVDHFYDCIYVPRTEVGIYTLVNTGEYVIQGRPLPFVDSDLVPLGVKIVNAGSHKIAIKKVDGLFEGNQGIYLEDTLLGIVHDLKAAPYTFTSEVGVFNSRFIVRYTSSALSNEDFDSVNNSVTVSSQNDAIAIKSESELMSSAIVYDILGRELARKNNINATDITFLNVAALNQTLIIKITLENGQVVTRKIIL